MVHRLEAGLALVAALVLGACVPAGSGELSFEAGASRSALRVTMSADRAAQRGPEALSQAVVVIDEVTAHGPDGWVTLLSGAQVTVDVLQLAEHAAELGFANLPAGKITQIRLHVDGSTPPYVVTRTGDRHPLKVPSGEQSGLKVKGQWSIGACETLTVDLALDGKKSIWIHPTGHGDLYVLRPVIRAGRDDVAPIDDCDPSAPPGEDDPNSPPGGDDGQPGEGDPSGGDPSGGDPAGEPGGGDPAGNGGEGDGAGDPSDSPGDVVSEDPNGEDAPGEGSGDPAGGAGGSGEPCSTHDQCVLGGFCDVGGVCASL